MAIRTYKVTLDTKNSIAPEPVFLRQGDKTGAVVIDATLMDNGSPVSLDGLVPMFKANTADGQAVIADSTGFNIVNASGGEFTYQVPNALAAVPGKIATAYFSFSDSSGSESTFDVAFIIKKAVDITKPQADEYITIIDGTLKSLQQKIDAMNTDIQTVLNAYNQGDFYNKEEVDAKTIKSGVSFTDTSVSNSFESQPLDVSNVATDGSKVTGETVLSDGYTVTSGTVDGTSQKVKTSVGPSGLISTITGSDGSVIQDGIWITKGVLKASHYDGTTTSSGSIDGQLVEQLSNVGKKLWSGSVMMVGSTTITPSIPLSDCLNGWILLWSQYINGAAVDGLFNFSLIPKFFVDSFSGKGITSTLQSTGNTLAMKYTYVTNTTLAGNDANGNTHNNQYVLREVRAF